MVTKGHGNPKPFFAKVERSADCMSKFLEAPQNYSSEVNTRKQCKRYYSDFVPERQQEEHFFCAGEGQFGPSLDVENHKVVDRCL